MPAGNFMSFADSDGDGASRRPEGTTTTISNEFARVMVEVIVTENGCRLSIRDVRHGTEIVLDPIELEALTRLTPDGFEVLVDPSFDGFASLRRARMRVTNGRSTKRTKQR